MICSESTYPVHIKAFVHKIKQSTVNKGTSKLVKGTSKLAKGTSKWAMYIMCLDTLCLGDVKVGIAITLFDNKKEHTIRIINM